MELLFIHEKVTGSHYPGNYVVPRAHDKRSNNSSMKSRERTSQKYVKLPAAGARAAAQSRKVARTSCMLYGRVRDQDTRGRSRNTGYSGTLSARKPGSLLITAPRPALATTETPQTSPPPRCPHAPRTLPSTTATTEHKASSSRGVHRSGIPNRS